MTPPLVGARSSATRRSCTCPPSLGSRRRSTLLFALLGLVAGAVGIGFTRVLYLVEDACDLLWKATRGPEWLRPAVGGVLLGLLLLALPQMYGVGYPVLEHGEAGQYALAFLAVLVVGKVLATSLTLGIGGSGGVFAPSLFIGAMVGAAFGESRRRSTRPARAGRGVRGSGDGGPSSPGRRGHRSRRASCSSS